jgi:hypothetical protein
MSVSGTNATILANLSVQTHSQVLSINDAGDCVGYEGSSAILWRGGTRTLLTNGARAVAINNRGQAVIAASSGNGPFIWTNGKTVRVQDLLEDSSGWNVFDADFERLNDNGWFIGGALDTNKNPHSVLIRLSPSFKMQPTNTTTIRGTSSTFSAVVSGAPLVAYQWIKQGTNLTDSGGVSGSLTSTLTINVTSAADAGYYSVIVTNAFGSVTSSIVRLLVALPPIVEAESGGIPSFLWGSAGAVLEQASDPLGPWTNVANASSPFPIPLPGPTTLSKSFFRLRAQ